MPYLYYTSGIRWLMTVMSLVLSGITASAVNFLDYYRAVAAAENAVVQEQYQDAVQQYQHTFSLYSYNNPVDCYVAAQVAGYIGDTAHCAAFITKGISFGLPLQTILSNPHLAPYIRSNGALGKTTIDSCLAVYRHRINKEARATAIALIQRDQAIVRNLPHGGLYERGDGRTLKPAYQPVWDSMLNEIIQLTNDVGFPAQKVIGTQHGDDGLFAPGPNATYIYFILIHHGNAWPRIGPLLRAELEKGNITPQMYGALADHSAGRADDYRSISYCALRPCGTRACKKIISGRINEINAARSAIGLCSYEVMELKHASMIAYYKWCKEVNASPKPVFDFQSDLHFMNDQ